ncbi:MAG: electron transfer flavoprotein subunit alpha [Desulfobulbaceae bacterium]|nr:electron transfer flavoprotein subunit alpha [Desulfobulbaceae bacterium]
MLKVSKELCVGCGICEDSCPFGAIEIEDGLAVIGESCTLCGACVESCELEALSLDVQDKSVQDDFEAWKGVSVYCEFRRGVLAPVSLELLGIGRKLADKRKVALSAILIGHEIEESVADTLIGHGADTVYIADHESFAQFREDLYSNLTSKVIKEYKPEIVLAGATAIGRSFIPGVATELNAGLTADCTALEIRDEDGALLQTRPAFGGNIMATIVCEASRPQMATVRPKVMKELGFDADRTGERIYIDIPETTDGSRIQVIESVVSENANVNIQEADILISGGRGLESEKGFALIRELAETMDAKVSASRAVVDAGWIPYPHQVGQTGKTVAPKLYIACGISGAVQHVAGMQSAETIVAINRDENASIFDVADFGVVGDLFEILPKLIRKIEERR